MFCFSAVLTYLPSSQFGPRMCVKYFPDNGDAEVERETELKKSAVLEAFHCQRSHT